MHTHQERPYKGIGMEGRIATWYAKNTGKSIHEFRNLADRLTKEVPVGGRILEVAPGPGYLAVELAKRGSFQVTGLDISHTFVEIAQANARRESVTVDFRHGNASAMPFDSNTFDFVVCRAAFKNFTQPVEAMNEMLRVLKPGGHALIIDLNKNASMKKINAEVDKLGLGRVDSFVTLLVFRFALIPRAYSKERFTQMVETLKFGAAQITESGIGFEIVLKKDGNTVVPITPPVR